MEQLLINFIKIYYSGRRDDLLFRFHHGYSSEPDLYGKATIFIGVPVPSEYTEGITLPEEITLSYMLKISVLNMVNMDRLSFDYGEHFGITNEREVVSEGFTNRIDTNDIYTSGGEVYPLHTFEDVRGVIDDFVYRCTPEYLITDTIPRKLILDGLEFFKGVEDSCHKTVLSFLQS